MPAPSPPNSLPPPSPPPEVFARARVRALEQELEALDEPRGEALIHYELGALNELRLGDRVQAMSHYRAATQRWPRFLPALLAQVTLLSRQDRHLEAAAVWRTFADVSLVPRDRASALCELGLIGRDRMQDGEVAVAAWTEALEIDPSCITATLLLEQEQRSRGNMAGAEAALARHVSACSDPSIEASLLLELALAREHAGSREQARALLAEACELGAEPLAVSLQRERLARDAGDHETRVEALHALARHAATLAQLGADAWATGRAAALHREAARIQVAHLSDEAGAMESFAAALALRPHDALVLRERMLARRQSGDPAGAVEDLNRLLEQLPEGDPAQPQLRRELALLLGECGDQEEALQALQATAAAAPESPSAQLALEDELRHMERWQDLGEHLEKRAAANSGAARGERLLQAGRLWLAHGLDAEHGLSLLRAAAGAHDDAAWRVLALREEYGAALRVGQDDHAGMVLRELTESALAVEERSVLRLHDYLLRSRPVGGSVRPEAGLAALERAVDDPACAGWAPAVARVVAAQNGRYSLLARAHRGLASATDDARTAAAHLAAAGRAALRDGDRSASERDLRAALELAPDDRYALLLLEQELLDSGDAAEASRLLRDAAEQRVGARERALALLQAGSAAEEAGDLDAALRNYEDAAQDGAEALSSAWARLRLGARSGNDALRKQALETLVQLERQQATRAAHLALGEELALTGDSARAAELLKAALGSPASELAAATLLSVLPGVQPALRQGALARIDGASEGAIHDAVRSARLADALALNPVAGERLLEHARSQRPDDIELLLTALQHAHISGERAELLRGLGRASADADAACELLLHAMRSAQLAEGVDALGDAAARANAVVERAPRSLEAAIALDETLQGGDDPEARAAALFGRLAHTTPACAPALRAARTRALLAAGRAREAIDAARHVLAEAPDNKGAWEILREAGAVLGDWDTVAEAAERLAAQVQGPLRAALLEEAAGVFAQELGDGQRARTALVAALAADPMRHSAFDQLHDLLADAGELEALLELLERQLESCDAAEAGSARGQGLAHDLAVDLAHERALVLRALGLKVRALEAVDDTLQRQPTHVEALQLRAELLTELERWEDAVSTLRRLATSADEDELRIQARMAAAELLDLRLDEPGQARTELAAAPQRTTPDPERRLRMARLAQRAGEYSLAAADFEHAAELATPARAAQYHYEAGTLLAEMLADAQGAAAAFRRALAAQATHAASLRALHALEPSEGQRGELLETFIVAVEAALWREPENPGLLRALDLAGELTSRPILRERALSTLHAMRLADDSEESMLARLAVQPAGQDGEDEASTVEVLVRDLEGDLDENVHAMARLVTPLLPDLSTGETVSPSEDTKDVREALDRLAERVGVKVAGLQRADDGDTLDLGGTPEALRWLVGDEVRALGPAQRFAMLRLLGAARLGVLPFLRGSREGRARTLEIMLCAAGLTSDSTQVQQREGRELAQQLSRKQRKALERLGSALTDPSTQADAYMDALERLCERMAMLRGRDPGGMLAAGQGSDELDLDMLAASPRALDLLRFWVSPRVTRAADQAEPHDDDADPDDGHSAREWSAP